MVDSLPRPVQLKLRHTLAQWRQWDCDPPLTEAPVHSGLLSTGLSNFSVLVEAGRRFVVRIDGINPAAHSLSRQGEWRALRSAHGALLAPRPCYFNPELGSLVCDYLPPDPQQPLDIADLADLFRGIHQLPARHHRLDLGERILGYQKQLEHRGTAAGAELVSYRGHVQMLLDQVGRRGQPLVLCHNDLLRANRIYSAGRLWAIDWEYSAMSSPWYDLAVAAAGDSLGREQVAELLGIYLQRAPAAGEFQLLQQYVCIYRYLELLWYLALEHTGLDNALLQRKLRQLDSALAAC